MQPPPRKGNFAKFLKNLHSEQINKLVAKNQHECDLLEDIRTYTIKKCAIEKSYSEAMLKISSGYLNKKIPNIPDIKLDGGDEKWNMWNVWRTVLEENEKLARARLAAVEVFHQQIAEDAKFLRAHKCQTSRKCVEYLTTVQKELQLCVQDVDKTKKFYFDEEHSAHDVRDKARDIEEKLKKKKGSFFQSITSLQKNSQKFSSKREMLEEKSAGARNDYLLSLAAANAHQTRYFLVDLQLCMTTMESGVYDKVAEYLTLMGRTELLTCSAIQNSFSVIRDQAKQLTREYNLQCCYLYYPVLKQHIQYDFEPCDNDPIDLIAAEHESATETLTKEARRWATKIARENNNIKESIRKLQIYNALRESGQKVDPNDQNGPDLEMKIEEMKQNVRKAETAKTKAEARIECLRKGGINVDEWLQEAESLTVQDIQRSASSLSVGDHPSSDSFYDSDFGETEALPGAITTSVDMADMDDKDSDHFDNAEAEVTLEQERQRIEQLTAGWDDPTQADWGAGDDGLSQSDDMDTPQQRKASEPTLKCTALYSYTAQNPDELTIVENEQLEVVGEGDGDGWLRARNYRGEEGYVPHNYLDVETEKSSSSQPALTNQISFSSVDYTIDNEEESLPQSETNQSPEQVSVISVPQDQEPPPKIERMVSAQYCMALYDYDGEGEGELTFEEGQIIRILSKCAHSVDDGWWQGDLEGAIGNFPSLVVEECDEYGEPITNDEDESPPPSAPPIFTPPDAPAHFLEDDVHVIDSDDFEEKVQTPASGDVQTSESVKKESFSMVLTKTQHSQYDTQFGNGEIPDINIPCVEIQDEEGQSVKGQDQQEAEEEFGLGVAQIVITAATPMIEEAETSFPKEEPDQPPVYLEEDEENLEEEEQEEVQPKVDATAKVSRPTVPPPDPPETQEDEQHDSGPFVISSSTGSDGETTGPSTAENSISHAHQSSHDVPVVEPKQVVGGRASIPDELEPHQLAQLQDLKESNA